MKKEKRLIIGFDYRFSYEKSIKRLDYYTFQNLKVLSGDPNVWERPREVYDLLDQDPEYVINPLTLATNFEFLKKKMPSNVAEYSMPMAISLSSKAISCVIEKYGSFWFSDLMSEDDLLSQGWDFMGFDVLDINGLYSGINGCGYKEDTRELLKRNFSKYFNDFSLISLYQKAVEFSDISNREIPAHAPFYSVGIFTLSLQKVF